MREDAELARILAERFALVEGFSSPRISPTKEGGDKLLSSPRATPRVSPRELVNSASATRLTPRELVNSSSATRLTPRALVNSSSATRLTPRGLVNSGSATRLTPRGLVNSGSATRLTPREHVSFASATNIDMDAHTRNFMEMIAKFEARHHVTEGEEQLKRQKEERMKREEDERLRAKAEEERRRKQEEEEERKRQEEEEKKRQLAIAQEERAAEEKRQMAIAEERKKQEEQEKSQKAASLSQMVEGQSDASPTFELSPPPSPRAKIQLPESAEAVCPEATSIPPLQLRPVQSQKHRTQIYDMSEDPLLSWYLESQAEDPPVDVDFSNHAEAQKLFHGFVTKVADLQSTVAQLEGDLAAKCEELQEAKALIAELRNGTPSTTVSESWQTPRDGEPACLQVEFEKEAQEERQRSCSI